MKKYMNVDAFLEGNGMTRDDLKCMVADSAVLLAIDCANNFGGEPSETAKAMQPIYFLNKIIEEVQ